MSSFFSPEPLYYTEMLNTFLPKYSRMPSKFSSDVTYTVFKIYFKATLQVNGFWSNSLKKVLIPLGKNVSKHQLLDIIFP